MRLHRITIVALTALALGLPAPVLAQKHLISQAALISIVETCRRLDIPLREYLRDVLPKIGGWSSTHIADLTPAHWKAPRQSPTPPVA